MRRIWRRFSFFGRASRREYWLTAIPVNVLLFGGLYLIDDLEAHHRGALEMAFVLTAYPLALALNLAVAVRRLHDRGASGLWIIALFGGQVALAFAVTALGQTSSVAAGVVALGMMALFVAGVVILGILPGAEGANRHGGGMNAALTARAFD